MNHGIGGRVLVIGTGISGVAAARLLLNEKIDVALFDENTELDVDGFYEKNPDMRAIPLMLGKLTQQQLRTIDTAVLSPGVPTDSPMVESLVETGTAIWGEVELAYRFGRGRTAAITGTNGKTTTTSLVGEIFGNFYDDARTVGNIGIPYTSEAATMTDETVTAAEISSFQLETIHEFKPDVSAILNITPDHLNRHHTMEAYIAAKESITKNQTKKETCVLNYEDERLREFGKNCPATAVYFSSKRKLDDGYYLDGEDILSAKGGKSEKIIGVRELNLLGEHNFENVMAAIAIATAMGVPMDVIQKTLREFKAVEHRIEFVTEKRGVKFYNDSKGTNTDAAIKGIRAMDRPTLLIGGGYDKDAQFDEWIESFDGKVKLLALIGETAEKIEDCARRHGFTDVARCDTLDEAVRLCYERSAPGDAILHSPACAR
ncbi:MAG: UDP-N-acetylmuramoyl-L-alanine--D-glutamate ligase, partial [Clostridiales bacterium]|nr:UDP-N-acetylmuramoyl-L-alanine--D-glutamate ligase [Clostridiales bacterium]